MTQALLAASAVLICLTTGVSGDVGNCHIGEIVSLFPLFLEGESISLICIKNGSVDSGLAFVRNKETVQDDYITNLNDTTIAMLLPPLTKEMLRKVKLMMYFDCRDGPTCVRYIHVEVEYRPMAVQKVTCHVYNWQSMNCTWNLGVEYKQPDNMHVMLEYYFSNTDIHNISELEASPTAWSNCTKMVDKTGCQWEGDTYHQARRVYVRVRVHNIKRNVFAEEPVSNFLMHEITEPAPVEIKNVKGYNDTCVRVTWRPESSARILRFNLTYFSDCDTSKTLMVKMREAMQKKMKRYLCGLVPNSLYNISISAQYAELKPMGYWSKPDSRLYRVHKKVPLKCPDVVPGLYDQVDNTDRNLTIYWQPLHPCEMNANVSQVYYIITSDTHLKNRSVDTYNTLMSVSRLPTNITIRAQNNIGWAPAVTTVTVYPSNLAPTPSELVVEYSTVNGKGPVLLTVEPVDQLDDDITNITHTLVWCKGHDFCLEPVRWRDIEGSNTTEHVTDLTRFGLITLGYRGNQFLHTGIVWQKCVFQLGKSLAKPVLGAMDSQPVEGFRVDWQPQNCQGDTGYIKYYLLEYCKTDEEDSHYCPGVWTKKHVSKHNTSFIKDGLTADSHYVIRLTSVGKEGLNSTSDTVSVTVLGMMKGWLIAVSVLGVLLAIVVVVIIVCCLIRCRNNLENKTAVESVIIDQPVLLEMQGGNSEPPEKGLLLGDEKDHYTDPSTDSGHSSLNSNMTDGSRETDSFLSSSHVYSDPHLNHHPYERGIEIRKVLSSYARGSDINSAGTTISMYDEVDGNYGDIEKSELEQQNDTAVIKEEVTKNGDDNETRVTGSSEGKVAEIVGIVEDMEEEHGVNSVDIENEEHDDIDQDAKGIINNENQNGDVVSINESEHEAELSDRPEEELCASNDKYDEEVGICECENEDLRTKPTGTNSTHYSEAIDNSIKPFTTDTDTDHVASQWDGQDQVGLHSSEDLPDLDHATAVSHTNITRDLPDIDHDTLVYPTCITDSRDHLDGYGGHSSITSSGDHLDGYYGVEGVIIDIDDPDSEPEDELEDELDTSGVSDTLDGYGRASDINLSELSADDSEDFDVLNSSCHDESKPQENLTGGLDDSIKFTDGMGTSKGHGISKDPAHLYDSDLGPVEVDSKFKLCDSVRIGEKKPGLKPCDDEHESELGKNKDLKVKTAGQSSGDYHMATMVSSGSMDCRDTTVC